MPVAGSSIFRALLVALGLMHFYILGIYPLHSASRMLQSLEPFATSYVFQTGIITNWAYREAVVAEPVLIHYKTAVTQEGVMKDWDTEQIWPPEKQPESMNIFIWTKMLTASKIFLGDSTAVQRYWAPSICAENPQSGIINVKVVSRTFESPIALAPQEKIIAGPWYVSCSKTL